MVAQVWKIIKCCWDNEGRTAFMWASGKGADNIIAVFMRHNVDIQQVDKNGGSGIYEYKGGWGSYSIYVGFWEGSW